MSSPRTARPNDRIAYVGICFYFTVHLALLLLGSRFGNFTLSLFDTWVVATGLFALPVAALAATALFQLTNRLRRFSWVANFASLLTVLALWIVLYQAIDEAGAAV